MARDWFEDLFGFSERGYHDTRAQFDVVGRVLRSRINGRSYVIGALTTPSVREVREEARSAVDQMRGRLQVSVATGDVRRMHADPDNRGALFQVASQFNLLEMTGPEVRPEDGITRYASDRTQGPACALAAAAATVYRNYFVPVDGRVGQTHDHQIDCLSDLGASLGNADDALWQMRNGYALCTERGLATIARTLDAHDEVGVNGLRDLLRIGVHAGVQVTDADDEQLVTQAFCSALPVSYTRVPSERWRAFATLVLEGAYEATVWAAVLNARRTGCRRVFLTRLGGGAFGNEPRWIDNAMRRALIAVADVDLDVRIVSYGAVDAALDRLVAEFA